MMQTTNQNVTTLIKILQIADQLPRYVSIWHLYLQLILNVPGLALTGKINKSF